MYIAIKIYRNIYIYIIKEDEIQAEGRRTLSFGLVLMRPKMSSFTFQELAPVIPVSMNTLCNDAKNTSSNIKNK